MKIFIKMDANKLVTAQMEMANDRIPGGGTALPSNVLEVTKRTDGPWLGKVYTVNGDTFAYPAITKAQLESAVSESYDRWLRWKQLHLEAVARSEPAGLITALTNKENAAWTDIKQALVAWNQAT